MVKLLTTQYNYGPFFYFNSYPNSYAMPSYSDSYYPFYQGVFETSLNVDSCGIIPDQTIKRGKRDEELCKTCVNVDECSPPRGVMPDQKPVLLNEQNETDLIKIQNRNILPNNINLILSYIRRVNKSGKVVEDIISRLPCSKPHYNKKRFYAYQLYLKENITDFINKNAVAVLINQCDVTCSLFPIEEQLYYNKVCRILIARYLRDTCMLEVLTCLKIKKSKRQDHLKVHRYLREVLKGEKGLENSRRYRL